MTLPSPAQRLVEGLLAGTGRTLVVAGPPLSGKTDLMEALRAELLQRGAHLHNLKGEYRQRDMAFATLEGFDRAPGDAEEAAPAPGELAPSALAFVPMESALPASSRRRGDRPRGAPPPILGPSRPRSAPHVDAEVFWQRLVAESVEAQGAPVVLTVDEGANVDPESREVLLYVSERARLRPVALLLSLDSATPSFAAWEERLLGHGDVDWVRLENPKDDPRDAARAREAFDRLPEGCRRVLGLTSLMQGPVSEVTLSRVARLTFSQLGEALVPALEAGLIRVEGGKIIFAHAAFAHQVPELLSPAVKAEMHREIAEALAALNPEPNLQRRLELSHHFYEWYKGPNALRYLLETAELTERLHAYDTACDCLAQARECVPSLPAPDRPEAESEIRLLQCRAFAFAGRLAEAELSLREGVTAALDGRLPKDQLEEWVEGLLPVLESLGPRPSLVAELVELAERCHDADAWAAEVLLQTVLARQELDRGRVRKAKAEAERAARLARRVGPGSAQALALLAVGLTRLEGGPEEVVLSEKFLRSADQMLGRFRRYTLELEAEEALLRHREMRGERDAARRAREKAIPACQRLRHLPLELTHQLAIAGLLLDENTDARALAALRRAREIVEILHLVPPAPALFRLWLLEGRYHAATNAPGAARDRWEAVAGQPGHSVAPTTRAEARLRLAILEATAGRDEAAQAQVELLAQPELRDALRPEWKEWLAPLSRRFSTAVAQAASTPGSTA